MVQATHGVGALAFGNLLTRWCGLRLRNCKGSTWKSRRAMMPQAYIQAKCRESPDRTRACPQSPLKSDGRHKIPDFQASRWTHIHSIQTQHMHTCTHEKVDARVNGVCVMDGGRRCDIERVGVHA